MSQLSEKEYLQILDEYFSRGSEHLLVPRGDDCAVFSWNSPMCMSSDLFLQDVHFRCDYFSAQDIGYKSLAINISDISAMGAVPLGFDLNAMLPEWVDEDFWRGFLQGMSSLANEHELLLLGGDLAGAKNLGISITILGNSSNSFMQRGGVYPGDVLFVVGDLGLARTGFCVLEEGQDKGLFKDAVSAHLRPCLHVHTATALAGYPQVKGLMDVSDGLIADLPRFIGDSLGADLSLCRENLHAEVLDYAQRKCCSAVQFALKGGEDYALLGACSAEGFKELTESIPGMGKIGEVTAEHGIFLQGEKSNLQGFDHFLP